MSLAAFYLGNTALLSHTIEGDKLDISHIFANILTYNKFVKLIQIPKIKKEKDVHT